MHCAATTLLVLLLTPPVAAQRQHGGSGHSEHRHHLAFFIGGTRGGAEAESHSVGRSSSESDFTRGDFFTVGADYQYAVLPWMGLGPFVDYAGGDFRATVAGGGVFFKPAGGFQVLAAPAVERHDGENSFVFRLGFYYEIGVGDNWTLAPTYIIDFLKERRDFVYGATVGYGF